jgi:hypothetical protein
MSISYAFEWLGRGAPQDELHGAIKSLTGALLKSRVVMRLAARHENRYVT